MEENRLLQFVPFSSVISSTFWELFSKSKLNDLQLSTEPIPVRGIYNRRTPEGISPSFYVNYDSVSVKQDLQRGEILSTGTLINSNTIEEFKKRDKSELLKNIASKIWEDILSGEAEAHPSILSYFLIYVYADLKKYQYYYWCAFPAFLYPSSTEIILKPQSLEERIKDELLVDEIHKLLQSDENNSSYFTLVIEEKKSIKILPLSFYYETMKEKRSNCEVWLGFSDPSSSPSHPGWPMRNLITLAAVRWSDIRAHTVLGYREKVSALSSSCKESIVFEIRICDEELGLKEMPSPLGWEKNERGKMGPRCSNMMKSMDPSRVAESAVELNLRLMKWRLDPLLDLDLIKNCRCLLIGAGTLGCNVARCLMGWGVRSITFVDGGKVSYSNPVRQSLFQFDDCVSGALKAEAAAEALKKIFPRIDANGVCLSVPMPGHPVGPSQENRVREDVATLEKLIEDHHAIFLLTDSRESRWLPSLIGASKKKIVLTAALGFDSFLVMRHGVHTLGVDTSEPSLGCYFCNDVVAPGDSTSDRSLDQQCTVTRPGVSFMAAGHIVEMLIDVLQYPVRLKAGHKDCEVPHSLRYFLGRMSQLLTSSPSFKNCSACSSMVISAYEECGIDFLFKVFSSPSYLEEISGLKELHQESQAMELIALSEESDSEKEF